MSSPIRFSDWIKDNVQNVTFVSPTDKIILVSDLPVTKTINREDMSQSLIKTVLTTSGDLVTLSSGGDAVRLTRASLASDTAFTSKYVDRTGSTMSGQLALPDPTTAPPTQDNHATPKKYVEDQISIGSPVGTIVDYVGTAAPQNWLLLDGSTVINGQTLYPDLWAVLPTGMKSGSNIVLPDTRGRVSVGFDAGDTDFNTVGKTGGAKTHTLTIGQLPSHTHVQNSHQHTINHGHTASQAPHSHTINNHTHTIASHTHTISSHAHTINSHVHDRGNHTHTNNLSVVAVGDHQHSYPIAGVGTQPLTIVGSSGQSGIIIGLGNTNGAGAHGHSLSGGITSSGSGNTGGSGTLTSNGSGTLTSNGSGTLTSGNPSNTGTNSQTPAVTIVNHTGSSGSTIAVNQTTGSGQAHNNLQPYIAFVKIIKAA
jgi:microcystin-dependent protein